MAIIDYMKMREHSDMPQGMPLKKLQRQNGDTYYVNKIYL